MSIIIIIIGMNANGWLSKVSGQDAMGSNLMSPAPLQGTCHSAPTELRIKFAREGRTEAL